MDKAIKAMLDTRKETSHAGLAGNIIECWQGKVFTESVSRRWGSGSG